MTLMIVEMKSKQQEAACWDIIYQVRELRPDLLWYCVLESESSIDVLDASLMCSKLQTELMVCPTIIRRSFWVMFCSRSSWVARSNENTGVCCCRGRGCCCLSCVVSLLWLPSDQSVESWRHKRVVSGAGRSPALPPQYSNTRTASSKHTILVKLCFLSWPLMRIEPWYC